MSKLSKKQRLEKLPQKITDYQYPDVRQAADKNREAEAVRREEERRSLVEQRIQEAMAEGAFDNLSGAGKPLRRRENPYAEPGQQWAFDWLQRNNMAPEWIARGKAIRAELDAARRTLTTVWQRHQAGHHPAEWQRAKERFIRRVEKLNRKIDDYNLIVPAVSAQRPRLDVQRELRRITG